MSSHSNNQKISLPREILLELEDALNYPLFFCNPVGATLNDVLVVALSDAKHIWNLRARISDIFRYYYQQIQQPFKKNIDYSCYEGRMIFTWLVDRADIKAFVLPLINNYRNDDYIVIGPTANMKSQLPALTEFIVWDDLPKIDLKAWRREFRRCEPEWRNRVDKVLKKYSISNKLSLFLISNLQVQTQALMATSKFLDKVKPSVIITEYDRNTHASCLLLAAKQRNISSVTMVHASAMPYPSYGMTPILSTYVCCWGEVHRNKFINYGVNQDRLVVTGCQATSRSLESTKIAACKKVGVSADRPAVLLATSPIKLEDRFNYVSIFCEAMANLPEFIAIVRLHPAEKISEYQLLIDSFSSVLFLPNVSLTRDESLAAADIVISHESSFGIDALLKGKLVIVLNLDALSNPPKIVKELIEIAGCPSVTNSKELELMINKIMGDKNYQQMLLTKVEKYAQQHCFSYGIDAVKNVCRVIDYAIESGRKESAQLPSLVRDSVRFEGSSNAI